ncbi:Ig-like domain-containing protein [Planococcus donghaensis]|uniref:Ig-like domain-containing protein n=1 Tax=Planococcus donghaensis TaxID=414778 RepID=UPI0012EC0FCC|nr:Ig-like domain-containing protein [Planococcus donghaensis]
MKKGLTLLVMSSLVVQLGTGAVPVHAESGKSVVSEEQGEVIDSGEVKVASTATDYTVTTENESWSNKTIDGDLYIGPNSVVTIEGNVTVTGNVYVYGTLFSYGGLTVEGTLNARMNSYSDEPELNKGTFAMNGEPNSINLTNLLQQDGYDVPFVVNNMERENGDVIIKGKTLPFMNMSLFREAVPIEADGSFSVRVQEEVLNDVQFRVEDVFGNTAAKYTTNFTVAHKSFDKVQVTWDTVNDAKEYALYIDGQLKETVSGDTTSYTFENLDEGTKYELGIAAVGPHYYAGDIKRINVITLMSESVIDADPVYENSTTVTGRALPGANIELLLGGSKRIGSGRAYDDGRFFVSMDPGEVYSGATINVVTSTEFVRTGLVAVIVQEGTAPIKPTVYSVTDKDVVIRGRAEEYAEITVKVGDKVIAEGTVDENGNFSIAIPKQQAGSKLSLVSTNTSGNVSEATEITVRDVTPPERPVVDKVTDGSTSVTGTAEAGAVISVKANTIKIGTATVDQEGNYAVSIPKQQVGTRLEITVADKVGYISQATVIRVLDATAPEVPTVNEETDQSTDYTVTTENESWSNKTIDGDLYIGSNSLVTIDGNVTVTGNVYVYGTLASYGGLTIEGTLNARGEGYSEEPTFIQGRFQKIVGGESNSINLTNLLWQDGYEVPFVVNNKKQENGDIVIEGKTLPFMDMKLFEEWTPIKEDGTFKVTVQEENFDDVQFILNDAFGNTATKYTTNFTVAEKSFNEVQVTWDTDTDAKEYALYIDGQLRETVSADKTSYTFENLDEGEKYELGIATIDTHNNQSDIKKLSVITLISEPEIDPLYGMTNTVTGRAFPGTKIELLLGGEMTLGSGQTGDDGRFSVSSRSVGPRVPIDVMAYTGIVRTGLVTVIVQEGTAPIKPTVDPVTDKDVMISGTAEENAEIKVKLDGKVIAEGKADDNGNYSIAIPKQQAGSKLTITSTNTSGNTSQATEIIVSDVTAPEKPVVDKVTNGSTSVTGTAEAGAVVTVKADTIEIGTATVDQEGNYAVSIPTQQVGAQLEITVADKAGNISEATHVTVLDVTAPALPTVTEVTDKSTEIKGSAEANATISVKVEDTEIGTATANKDGEFVVAIAKQQAGTKLSITATDLAGNVSEVKTVMVVDVTAPDAPTVDKVTDNSTIVTGSGEVDALITIKVDDSELATTTVSSEGKYRATISAQKAGTKIQVTATDAAGNTSETTEVTVVDESAPKVPTVNEVTDQSTVITGNAEAESLVSVTADNSELATATADADGKFSIEIAKQQAGTKLTITATDAVGNISSAKEVVVLDVTAPNAPTVSEVTEQSTIVTGAAEVASQVTVKVDDKEIATTTVSGDGNYSVTIPKQKAGTVLSITATDKAGNKSSATEVVVTDGTAPAIELESKVTQYSTRIIGTAEADATITVENKDSTIGTATADAKGKYEVEIKKQKVGTKLSIIATDAAGNNSEVILVTVEDGNYPDLKLSHWALDKIMYLADEKIIGGYPDGGFQPEKNTTRAEAAKMLAIALDLPIEDVPSGYKDVSDKHWGKNYIAAVSKAGLFTGNPDGTFAPNDGLKRAEMAKIISIAYELDASDKNHFSDVKAGHWSKGYISGLFENGITTGYPDKTFQPGEPTTRAEYSVFLARAKNEEFRN